jgi:hypothetical protein
MGPRKYRKAKCAGCERLIAHTSWGTPRRHHCSHGRVCIYSYGLLGTGGPDHPKAARDQRYEPCRECAEARPLQRKGAS